MDLKSEYIGGISFDSYSLRKYKKTIISNDNNNGKTFFVETKTPRDKHGFYLDGKSFYYLNETSKIYKSYKSFLKSIL